MFVRLSLGPGKDMFESTKIIGTNQFEHAKDLYAKASEKLEGKVDYRHSFLDMRNKEVTLADGSKGRTCPAALGYR